MWVDKARHFFQSPAVRLRKMLRNFLFIHLATMNRPLPTYILSPASPPTSNSKQNITNSLFHHQEHYTIHIL